MTALIFSWPWREILDELNMCSQEFSFSKLFVLWNLMNDNASELANIN